MAERNSDGVRLERTGYRDDALNDRVITWGEGFVAPDLRMKDVPGSISDRHHDYGDDCPIVNLDFLLLDYDLCKPVALADFKKRSYLDRITHGKDGASILATIALANLAKVPFFVIYYDRSYQFKVVAKNPLALEAVQTHLGDRSLLSEVEFVSFLYAIRRRTIPANIAAKLNH